MNFKHLIIVSMSMVLAQTIATKAFSQEELIENEQIDISGDFTEKPKETPADRLKALRAKLEKQNELLMKKKIEQARMDSEIELMRKLQKAFDENMKKLDSIH